MDTKYNIENDDSKRNEIYTINECVTSMDVYDTQ